jgi:16S rRNA U516 pseudouridylate synthase RsuA-like enzyme
VHVRLGAITRTLDAHERRLKLMAAAGYVSRSLAAPLVEQEMVKLTQTVADVLRRHNVADDVIGELVTTARQRMRAPLAIEGEAVAA